MEESKILIVEDESLVALEISRTLKELGFQVLGPCRSREDTLEILDHDTPHLVLMDINIQGATDGIELAVYLNREKRLPIIFLTAQSDDKTLKRATLAEPYGYLSKSFYHKDIRPAIVTALNSHRLKLLVEEQEELLSLTLGNIDEGVITTDGEGNILFYNHGAVKLFYLAPYDRDGTVLRGFPAGISLYSWQGEILSDPLRQETLPDRLFLHRDGERIPLECRVNHYWGAGTSAVERIYLFRDISQQLKIQEVTARLSSVVEYSEDAIAAVSLYGIVLNWNRGAEKILGIPQDQAVGRSLSRLLPLITFPEWENLEDSGQSPTPVLEGLYRDPEGETKKLSVTLSTVRGGDGSVVGYSFIARDLSYRIQLERQIIDAEDNERRRIGRDLHDSLGQQLTGISLMVKALHNVLNQENSDKARRMALELGEQVKIAITETRELSRGLVPEILRDEGFFVAMKDLALYYGRVRGVHVEWAAETDSSLEPGVETQLYHIAQEAINNAVRHGGADEILVKFYRDPEGLSLLVADNGCGFSESQVQPGLGLGNMRYRADVINGRLRVESEPGRGTRVICVLT